MLYHNMKNKIVKAFLNVEMVQAQKTLQYNYIRGVTIMFFQTCTKLYCTKTL